MRVPKSLGGIVSLAVMGVILTAVGIAVLTRIPGVWPMLVGNRAG